MVKTLMKTLIYALAALVFSLNAHAETVSFTVTDQDGAPVPNAVVLADVGDGASAPETFEWPNAMAQHQLQFKPHVLVAPLGSEVEFPNQDRVRHHVYSFSKGNKFELELYGREEKRYVTFDKPGIVSVGCNIHDGMVGFIRVVDTPYAVKTDENGIASLDLPAGTAELTIWHPYGEDEIANTITVETGTAPEHTVTLVIEN